MWSSGHWHCPQQAVPLFWSYPVSGRCLDTLTRTVANQGGKCRDKSPSVPRGNYGGRAPTQTRSFGGSSLSGDMNNKRASISSSSRRERGKGGIYTCRDPEA